MAIDKDYMEALAEAEKFSNVAFYNDQHNKFYDVDVLKEELIVSCLDYIFYEKVPLGGERFDKKSNIWGGNYTFSSCCQYASVYLDENESLIVEYSEPVEPGAVQRLLTSKRNLMNGSVVTKVIIILIKRNLIFQEKK